MLEHELPWLIEEGTRRGRGGRLAGESAVLYCVGTTVQAEMERVTDRVLDGGVFKPCSLGGGEGQRARWSERERRGAGAVCGVRVQRGLRAQWQCSHRGELGLARSRTPLFVSVGKTQKVA